MTELMALWADWLRPSAGLPTVQWSLLLALAAAAGHLLQRHTGLPQVVGCTAVGSIAGLAGFSGLDWPLRGVALFLIELGVSVVLFEAGGRLALRWLRHNPMVLLQSLLAAGLTGLFVYQALRWSGVRPSVAESIGILAIASSPAVFSRVASDSGASGPVTERAGALATLGALYALTLVNARTGLLHRDTTALVELLVPVAVVLGVSLLVAAVLALALKLALGWMNPASENTAMLLIALIAAATAVAAHLGGSAPLAALLGGLLLKQLHPRPWSWPRQLGIASSLLTLLMFVMVAVVAARAPWNHAVAGTVAALVLARGAAQVLGVLLANRGSGTSLRQAAWVGLALSPMASLSLLLASQYAATSLTQGPEVTAIVLPAILLMEVLGAMLATVAIYRSGESTQPEGGEPLPGLGDLRG
ncbi:MULTISPECIES: cation:proton antiporter [Ramlibacter]|uniref:Cation:proton antiporter n=1 Tax=Ramlibacter aquaticus TaxID=2780094 RepID=A0ABR9SF88_9BURK|nr:MULTISPECIES: cation:proton antiporter [Ramlibacter]MBE7940412.1 cation:proton antiporter [Ramlibacter aquaticus]